VLHVDDTPREYVARLTAADGDGTAAERTIGESTVAGDIILGGPRVQPEGDEVAVRVGIRTHGGSGAQRCCLAPQGHAGGADIGVESECNTLGFRAGPETDGDGPVRGGTGGRRPTDADVVVTINPGSSSAAERHVVVTFDTAAGAGTQRRVELASHVLAGGVAHGDVVRLVTPQHR